MDVKAYRLLAVCSEKALSSGAWVLRCPLPGLCVDWMRWEMTQDSDAAALFLSGCCHSADPRGQPPAAQAIRLCLHQVALGGKRACAH